MTLYRHFHAHHDHASIPSVTCALREVGSSSDGYRLYDVAFAVCSPNDNFSRATGREIAEGRLNDNIAVISFDYDGKGNFLNKLFHSICNQFPHISSKEDKHFLTKVLVALTLHVIYHEIEDGGIDEYQVTVKDEVKPEWYWKFVDFLFRIPIIRWFYWGRV